MTMHELDLKACIKAINRVYEDRTYQIGVLKYLVRDTLEVIKEIENEKNNTNGDTVANASDSIFATDVRNL